MTSDVFRDLPELRSETFSCFLNDFFGYVRICRTLVLEDTKLCQERCIVNMRGIRVHVAESRLMRIADCGSQGSGPRHPPALSAVVIRCSFQKLCQFFLVITVAV